MNSGIFCCESFLALVVETCLLRFIMVVFTLFCSNVFLYGGMLGLKNNTYKLKKKAVRVTFDLIHIDL